MDKMNPLRLLVILIGLIGVAVLTVSVIGWLTQPIRTADGVRERLGDPDNVLYQYEHFYDLCQGVVATDKNIQAKQVEVEAYDECYPNGDESDRFQAAPKRDRLATELSGLKQHRNGLEATYNADSAKLSRDLFKADSLPERITDKTPDCG